MKVPSNYQDADSYYGAIKFYTDTSGYCYIKVENSVVCKITPIINMSFSEVSVDVSTLTEMTRIIQ